MSRRGSHKVKPAKSDISASVDSFATTGLKRTQTTPESRWPGLMSKARLSSSTSSTTESKPTSIAQSRSQTAKLDTPSAIVQSIGDLDCDEQKFAKPDVEVLSPQALPARTKLIQIAETEDDALDCLEVINTDSAQSSASSSLFSADSTSIYSRTSSIYSKDESIYSFDDGDLATRLSRKDSDTDASLRVPTQGRRLSVQRSESSEAAQERSALAKKAAMYKNSRLTPELPTYSVSLPTWAMVCRAVQASQDCYDSRALTRQGRYTPADPSKDVKAMIVDDQLIDGSRLVIVAIRGTQFQSLTDWTVNADSKPVRPTGFLDDEENLCHSGFLQIAKAMISQVATQLKEHPAASERPSLLFTGHSAGAAIAAMLYSHMLQTSCDSELIQLAKQFPIIHCMTFGAPPLTQRPLPRRDNGSGVFLAFTNEGDPVPKLSDAAYFKTLAKLRTSSPPACFANATVTAPVKIVRGSRGGTVYKQALAPVASIPWEELPLWPTPPPASQGAGEIVLLRDRDDGRAVAARVDADDLVDVIWGDLAQHTLAMYTRRVKQLALAAMMGRENHD